MGIWTGMLNDKVGNFKFIYVKVLVETETELEEETTEGEKAPVIRQQRLCRRPRPKTLLELLERLKLEVSLLLNTGVPNPRSGNRCRSVGHLVPGRSEKPSTSVLLIDLILKESNHIPR